MKAMGLMLWLWLAPTVALAANTPFACDLRALSPAERARHAELAREWFGAVRAKRELADGYAVELPPAMWLPAAQWADLERRCCPFFAFELRAAGNGGPLWLRITGPPGAKAFMREGFGL